MTHILTRRARLAVAVLAAMLVASCGLPSTGPTKRNIFAGSVMEGGNAYVVSVTDRVTRAANVSPALGFSEGLRTAGQIGPDTIRPGDTLGLTIWENVQDGLLATVGGGATVIEEVQVDASGFIFVPYAGRIRAAGNTPEAVRRIITERLGEQTPDPQVEVRRVAGDGAAVTMIGAVGAQGVYPIERPTRTLTAMLAQAGGIAIEPEIARITVIRGTHRDTIWFQDLFENPQYDIALRDGDRILVEEDTRSYTALGATGAQRRMPFESQSISAIEALAQVGGLSSAAADPTGIFVFRDEPEPVARQVLGLSDIQGPQRVVYLLDLTAPNGVFLARDFAIRDEDTVYVTEAPFVQWNKTISALTGTLTQASALNTLAEDVSN